MQMGSHAGLGSSFRVANVILNQPIIREAGHAAFFEDAALHEAREFAIGTGIGIACGFTYCAGG